eukprot:6489714-Amphidinium_carterae.1
MGDWGNVACCLGADTGENGDQDAGWSSVCTNDVASNQEVADSFGWGAVASSACIDDARTDLECGAGSAFAPQQEQVLDLTASPPKKRPRGRPRKESTPNERFGEVFGEKSLAMGQYCTIPTLNTVASEITMELVSDGPSADVARNSKVVSLGSKLVNGYVDEKQAFLVWIDLLKKCLISTGASMDEDYVQVCSKYLDSQEFHTSSVLTTAREIGVSSKVLQGKLCRLVSGVALHERLMRYALEKQLTLLVSTQQPGIKLRMYIDVASYDETPMRTRCRADSAPGTQKYDVGEVASDLGTVVKLDSQLGSSNTKVKKLQSQCLFLFLVEVNGVKVRFLGDTCAPLQSMASTDTESQLHCQLRVSSATSMARHFDWRSRSVCTDSDGANLKAEVALAKERNVASLHTSCEVHKTNKIYTRAYEGLLKDHVTGLVHTALAVQEGSWLALFRSCLRQEIQQRLVVCRGRVCDDAQTFRKEAIKTFLGERSAKASTQRLLLCKLPNGDWRNTSQVQHFVDDDCVDVDKQEVSKILECGLCFAMLSKKPVIWARSRWGNADACVDQLGLLEAVHGLLTHAFNRLYFQQSKLRAGPEAQDDGVLTTATGSMLVSNQVPQDATIEQGPPEASNFLDTPSALSVSAEQHSKDRQQGYKWLQSGPFGMLALMRISMRPLQHMMARQFYLISPEFELQERAHLARLTKSGAATLGSRQYMVT